MKFWPPKIEIFITNLIIHKIQFNSIPECEFDAVGINNSKYDLNIELKNMYLFNDGITYEFPPGDGSFYIVHKSSFKKHFLIKNQLFEAAMKIVQPPKNYILKISYKINDVNSSKIVIIEDSNVEKCTYWQRPLFNSKEEGKKFASGEQNYTLFSHIGHKKIETPVTIFTDWSYLYDLNMKDFLYNLRNKHTEFPIYWPAFRRKYGGSYIGVLDSDSIFYQNRSQLPFATLSDYEQLKLFGITLNYDLRSYYEFIHYYFSSSDSNCYFGDYQDRSKYFILIAYETPDSINDYTNALREMGYRVGSVPSNKLGALFEFIISLPSYNKLGILKDRLNNDLSELNEIIKNNGEFIYFPTDPPPPCRKSHCGRHKKGYKNI